MLCVQIARQEWKDICSKETNLLPFKTRPITKNDKKKLQEQLSQITSNTITDSQIILFYNLSCLIYRQFVIRLGRHL